MSGYGEPDWVNPNAASANTPTTVDANTGGNLTAPPSEPARTENSWWLWALSILNMGLCAMMAALGVLTIIEVESSGVGELSEPFLAAYMVMFAGLLFTYELMWWAPSPAINKALRKNFGFMYGLQGKGLYLVFVACLCLGLGRDAKVKELNWATGIAFLAVGCFHIFIVCARPDLAMKYVAPTAGLTGGGSSDLSNVI